jgi:hypothetical protein
MYLRIPRRGHFAPNDFPFGSFLVTPGRTHRPRCRVSAIIDSSPDAGTPSLFGELQETLQAPDVARCLNSGVRLPT